METFNEFKVSINFLLRFPLSNGFAWVMDEWLAGLL